jgi:hypothetical protein
MRLSALPIRPLVGLVVALVLLLAAVDAGSVVLTRLRVPDETRSAGAAAADAVRDLPATRQSAVRAHQAANRAARSHGLRVLTRDFRLYPDGRVRLTATRTAPTLLLHRISWLSDLAVVTASETVDPRQFS